MTNKINYRDGPMEEVKIAVDFLPSPEELVFREETVKVTPSAEQVLIFSKKKPKNITCLIKKSSGGYWMSIPNSTNKSFAGL